MAVDRLPRRRSAVAAGWILLAPLCAAGDRTAAIEGIRARIAAEDYSGAVEPARELVAADAKDAEAQLLLAQVLEWSGQDGADEALATAIDLGAKDARIQQGAGDVFAARFESQADVSEHRRAAEECYARWEALEPGSALPLQRRAKLALAAGDRDAALGLLLSAVARDPMEDAPHGDLWSFLGRELRYPVLEAYYRGLSAGAATPAARSRCRDFAAQVQDREAQALREEAARLREQGDTGGSIARLERARGLHRRAVEGFLAAAELDETARPRMVRFVAQQKLKQVQVLAEEDDWSSAVAENEEAQPALLALLAADPRDAEVRGWIDSLSYALFVAAGGERGARMDWYRGRMTVIFELWAQATTIVADCAEWLNNLGFFGREAGRFEESYTAYEACLKLAPQSCREHNDTALILLYHLHRDLDRAEVLLARAVELGLAQWPAVKDDPAARGELHSALGDALLNRGRLCAITGRADEAAKWFARLDAFAPRRIDTVQNRLLLALCAGDDEGVHRCIATFVAACRSDDPAANAAWLDELKLDLDHAGAKIDPARVDAVVAEAAAGLRIESK